MVLNPTTARTPWSCATPAGTPTNQQIAEGCEPYAGGRGRPPRWRTSRPPARPRSRPSRPARDPESRTAKAAFFVTGDGRFVVAIVRGDYDVNETKLVNGSRLPAGCVPPRWRRSRRRGMEAGYGSPLGARDAVVVVDELVPGRRTSSPAQIGSDGTSERQRPARLHAGPHRRDHERARATLHRRVARRSTPEGHRGRQHLQAQEQLTNAFGSMYLGEEWRAPPDRDELVSASPLGKPRVHRGGASRRQGARPGPMRSRHTRRISW